MSKIFVDTIEPKTTNGNITISTNGTTAATIDSTGRLLQPQKPMFDVAKSSTQTISTGTLTKITWDTENYDIGGNFGNDKFTAPVAGKYFMNAFVSFYQMGAGAGQALVWYKNGSAFRTGYTNAAEVNITFGFQATSVFDLSANDYIEVYVFQGSGSAQNSGVANNLTSVSAVGSNYWTGHLIG